MLRLYWVGTRTEQHDETVAFFHEVMSLPIRQSEPDFTVLEVPDGATVEVFGPRCSYNPHLTSPVAGFLVSDLEQARDELHEAGREIVLPIQRGDTGAWLHFRAPDGHLYELSEEWQSSR